MQASSVPYCYADDWYFLVDRFALRGPPGGEAAVQAQQLQEAADAQAVCAGGSDAGARWLQGSDGARAAAW